VAFLLAFGCGHPRSEKGGAQVNAAAGEIGSTAPEFELADLSGKKVHLSDFKGKVVILDFWATWCGPCRMEIPEFVKLQDKYRDKGLEIVGLSLDSDGESAVRPFAAKHGINYTMLLANDDTARQYGGIAGIPTTFVLDRQGKVANKFVGVTPPESFEQAIQPLLGG
jgi:cytochrome c biogenesis protein CcmG/thiol:disulfide interchange protein DsbE